MMACKPAEFEPEAYSCLRRLGGEAAAPDPAAEQVGKLRFAAPGQELQAVPADHPRIPFNATAQCP